MQTEREVRAMRNHSINHLSTKAVNELITTYSYDTKKYRYIYIPDEDKILRIEKSLLGTTETLNPENWIEQ